MHRQDDALMFGVVKRYNVESGYGFIKIDDGGDDCFVHQSEIQTEGFRALMEGDCVQFIFSRKNGRSTATQVCPRDGETLRLFKNKMDALQISETSNSSATNAVGTVKWFNQEKGYGFLVRDGFENEPDVFVHINKVKGLDFLSEGQRFQFDLVEEANGKLNAVNVTQLMEASLDQYNPYPPYASPSGYQSSPQRPQRNQYSSPATPPQTYGAPYSSPYSPPISLPPPSAVGVRRGTMKFFNAEKGFGFLFPSEGGKELYVGKTGLGADTLPRQLVKGAEVEYTIQTSDSKMWATSVRLVNGNNWQPQPRNTYGESYSSPSSKQNNYENPAYSSGPGYSPQPTAPHVRSSYSQQPAAPHAHSGYSSQPVASHVHSGYSPQPVTLQTHSGYSPQPIAPHTHSGYSQPTENSHPQPVTLQAHSGYSPQPIAPHTHSAYSQSTENSHSPRAGYSQSGQAANLSVPGLRGSHYSSYY